MRQCSSAQIFQLSFCQWNLKRKDISFLNGVISLFFLPLYIICHPTRFYFFWYHVTLFCKGPILYNWRGRLIYFEVLFSIIYVEMHENNLYCSTDSEQNWTQMWWRICKYILTQRLFRWKLRKAMCWARSDQITASAKWMLAKQLPSSPNRLRTSLPLEDSMVRNSSCLFWSLWSKIFQPLYTIFVWSQKCQKSCIPYLYNTDTSVKRTLGSVPLVSVLKRFDCNLSFSFCCQLVYPQDLARADAVMVIFLKAKNLTFMCVRSRQRRPSNMCPAICTNWNTNKKYIPTVFLFSFFFLLPRLHLVHFRPSLRSKRFQSSYSAKVRAGATKPSF